MDFNQGILSLLENEKDLLVFSDVTDEVVLPEIAKTCTYGERFTLVDIDGNIIPQADMSSFDSDPETQTSSKAIHSPKTASEVIPPSPVFKSSYRRGSKRHQILRSRKSEDMMTESPFSEKVKALHSSETEVIPPSPVFTSRHRKGTRRHELLRSRKNQNIAKMSKPPFSENNNEDCETAPSAKLEDSLDSTFPDIPEPDSPEASMTPRLRRMAASLGCEPEVESPAWERSLETPEGHGKPQSEEEELKPGEKKLSSSKSLFVETDMDAAVKK